MTIEIIKQKAEAAQNELARTHKELEALSQQAEELNLRSHNLKVQIATYQDLLTDNTEQAAAEVRDTVESLVAGE